jgi:L-rhamnose mutarotase
MHVAIHTRLKGAEELYAHAHRDLPAELVQAIRAAGVHAWTIWRSGRELFHVIDCDDHQAMRAQLEQLPVNVAWQARMAELLDWSPQLLGGWRRATLQVAWQL